MKNTLIGKIDAKSDKGNFYGLCITKHIEFSISHHRLLKSPCILSSYKTNTTPRKVVDGDDAGIENTKEEEPRNINIEESKDEPSLEALQRKENQHEDLPKT